MECSKFTQPDTKWFSHLKRVRPPHSSAAGGRSIFSPFRPRRGEKGREGAMALGFSTQLRCAPNKAARNAASGGRSIGRSSFSFQHFCQINIFLRRWSKSPNKKSCHYFWSFKVHWGSNSNPWSKSNFGRFTTHLQCF